ncbi:MAG: HdeD family acid-resistance protein [Solirubrobacteraceae bacterium]
MPELNDEESVLEGLRAISGLWWLTAGIGLLSILAGIIVLIKPGGSLKAIAAITGVFILIDGIVALLAAFSHSTASRGLAGLIGVLNLVVGVFLIRDPVRGVVVIALFVGIWLIATGALRLVLAFDARGERSWRLLVAAVELIAGIAIVIWPKVGLATLALLIGISLIVNGISVTALGFALRSIRDQ